MLSFDSGDAGTQAENPGAAGGPEMDTNGDLDLYKIDFRAAYDHWSNTFQGNMAAGMPGVGVRAPYVPAGVPAGSFNDYVTYGVGPVNASGDFDDVFRSHSNTFVLADVVQKVGEVKRNNGGNFFDFSLEFVDASTLVMIDDSSTPTGTDTAETDHEYRIIQRVSTSPGMANDAVGDHLDGGFNSGTRESWESRRIGLVNLDFAGGLATGHSEVESMAFYADPLTGVRGFWVTESDSSATTRGDDVAFYEIDASGNGLGYRPHAVGGGPDFPTSFALDNDPLNDSAANDGQADHIFIDSDTGDIIIVESGFGDAGIATVGADHQPSVIRREVLSYDDGLGRIQFGGWSEKKILAPTQDTGDTFLERGIWSAYDSVQDQLYVLAPGAAGETPAFEFDLFVLDVNTGLTTSYNNLDESIALFFGDSFGDVADFFFLSPATGPDLGDFNADGFVDAADYTLWRDNLGNADESAIGGNGDGGGITLDDYQIWKDNFGADYSGSAVAGAGVPEPSTLLIACGGIVAAMLAHRRLL